MKNNTQTIDNNTAKKTSKKFRVSKGNIKKTKKEIELFFEELLENCEKKTTYSVIEEAKKMGVDYKKVKKWAKSDEHFNYMLEMCRQNCYCNAERAALFSKDSPEEAFEYMAENNDRFKEEHEKQKHIEYLEKLEEEGKEIPPSKQILKLERNMSKKITKKNKQPETNIQKPVQYTDLESERVKNWKARKDKEKSSIKFKATKKKKRVDVWSECNNKNLDEYQQAEQKLASLTAATGATSVEYSHLLFEQTLNASFRVGHDNTFTANAIHDALLAFKPKDQVEGMLCSRLIVLHNQYMSFISRTTNPEQTTAGVDLNVNRATKLMRLYNETLETLNRYRRKGEQRVVVQHVNVNSGGQAIVGSKIHNQGGGAHEKK